MPDRLYGFRPKQRPQYQGADSIVNPVDPRVPRPIGTPPAPTSPLASGTETRINDYSGTSAEGEGSSFNNDPSQQTQAHYASPTEALQYGKAGLQNGYYGTVQDAAAANARGNQNATNTLQGFIAQGPTGTVKAPGTLGFLGGLASDALAGEENRQDRRNITDSLRSLSDSGDLYNNNNSSGYFGDSLHEQQTVSDVDATNTFGTFNTAPTLQQLQGPEVFHDAADTQAVQQQEQQANYDHYQDNSSDDNHGQTDGTQTGGETSHAGGYGGYADDTASGGGGGGGGK